MKSIDNFTNNKKPLYYSRHSINEEDIAQVCDVLHSDFLSQGPKRIEFEQALADLTGARHCIVVASGTAALHLCCLALDVKKGSTILISSLSFLSSANCVALCGGKPVFADIDKSTFCLSPDEVEKYCQKFGPPDVIMPVDFAGIPADLPVFYELSRKYGFRIIEDAAHAIGSAYSHDSVKYNCGSCSHTDMAIFSFHPVKNLTTGEGGAVFTNDDDLAVSIRRLANHGIERRPENLLNVSKENYLFVDEEKTELAPWCWEMQVLGLNYRLAEIPCALGLSQIKRLKKWKKSRQKIVQRYNNLFEKLSIKRFVNLPPSPPGTDICFHLYVLQIAQSSPITRDELYLSLRKDNIFSQVHYMPFHLHPYYQKKYGYQKGDFPITEAYFKNALSLPLYPALSLEDQKRVINSVLRAFKQKRSF